MWELVEQENVDEVMRGVQGSSEKTQVERFHALSVRMGMDGPSVMKSMASSYVTEEQTT